MNSREAERARQGLADHQRIANRGEGVSEEKLPRTGFLGDVFTYSVDQADSNLLYAIYRISLGIRVQLQLVDRLKGFDHVR
jgi:hypothetical protein